MEKQISIPAKHAEHINWNSIINPMLNVWQKVRVTQDEQGDVLVVVLEDDGESTLQMVDAMQEVIKLANSAPTGAYTRLNNICHFAQTTINAAIDNKPAPQATAQAKADKRFARTESRPLTDGSMVYAVAVLEPDAGYWEGRRLVAHIDCISAQQAIDLCDLINAASDVRTA